MTSLDVIFDELNTTYDCGIVSLSQRSKRYHVKIFCHSNNKIYTYTHGSLKDLMNHIYEQIKLDFKEV